MPLRGDYGLSVALLSPGTHSLAADIYNTSETTPQAPPKESQDSVIILSAPTVANGWGEGEEGTFKDFRFALC